MRAINEPAEVRIQGPTFSGSFDSLASLIEGDGPNAQTNYEVQSGTATDTGAGNVFKKTPRVTFHSASYGGKFEDVLWALRISPANAARLVEDESGYGQSFLDPKEDKSIRTFLYPRDISHLRNAYREAAQTKSNGAPPPELDFSIKDTETGEDSVPVFSKAHSPLSQNAIINEITGAIRRDRIRIVQINATNVLDLLFLTRVLKRQCPDTRILISSPDLLFVEAAQTEGLTGTLALSTYPLFAASNEWMGQQNLPATFSDANSEGVYNATVMLLDPQRKNITDYPSDETDSSEKGRPQSWLLTLDREGFAPVQRFPDAPAGWFKPVLPPFHPAFRLPRPASLTILLSGAIAFSILSVCVWTIILSRDDKPVRGAAFCIKPLGAADGNLEDKRSDDERRFHLFLFVLLLATMQAILWTPLFWDQGTTWSFQGTGALPALGIAAAICVLTAIYLSALADRRKLHVALLAVLTVEVLWAVCCFRGERGFFFSFRALELRFGTSPLLPVLAALGILLAFSFVHLLRFYMVVYEMPEVAVDNIQTACSASAGNGQGVHPLR